MQYVAGTLLTIDGPIDGYIAFDNQKVLEYGEGKPAGVPIAEGWIIPSLVNAHTHIGDTFIRKKYRSLPHNIEQLVAPPSGLKHKALQQASKRIIINGMTQSLDYMIQEGIGEYWDFREGGLKGLQILEKAQQNHPINGTIFARPSTLEYHNQEVEQLLVKAQGIGVSSISDWEEEQLHDLASHVHNRKKRFAIHASERIREDIHTILSLSPLFVIHMVKGTAKDYKELVEHNVPVVICPRSNMFFGLQPPLKMMKKQGVKLLLGTDNAMLHYPSIIEEMRYILQHWSVFTEQELLHMITYTPRKVLNPEADIPFPTQQSDFVVLEKKTLEPLFVSRFKQDGYHED